MSRWGHMCLLSIAFAVVAFAEAVFPAHAETSDGMAEIVSRLEATPVVRASFTQARHMEILSKPILTEGRMVFAESHGIAWLIEAPYRTNLALTRAHVTEWGEGEARQRTPLLARPGLAALVSILIPLLSADFDELAENFIVEGIVSEAGWKAALAPRDGVIARAISSIEISGDSVVKEIAVREAAGDWTQLLFSEYRPTPERLTVEELAYFEE